MMDSRESISVFFPAFNDGASIGSLVKDANDVLRELTNDYEIIVVNDGSSDNTGAVLGELSKELSALKTVTHETNRGYGGALRSGFRACAKELVFYTDGDGQYDVRELKDLFAALTDGVDVVNGYKIKRHDNLVRIAIGKVYQHAIRILFGLPIRDVDCDFRLIRREKLSQNQLTTNSGAICVEIVKSLAVSGSKFAEVAVNHYPRTAGRSQFFRPRAVARTLAELLRIWLYFQRTKRGKKAILLTDH